MFVICPKCLSIESEQYCSQCGFDLHTQESASIFKFRVGWSKSRSFEEILKEMRSETGYEYLEQGEDIFHEIPVKDLNSASQVLKKYKSSLKWKDTIFKLDSGKTFDIKSPEGMCFVNLMLEGTSPCKRNEECPYFPFPLRAYLEDTADFLDHITSCGENCDLKIKSRIFISLLMQHQNVLKCPLFRALATLVAAKIFPENTPWSFIVSGVRQALNKGTLLFNDEGNYLNPPSQEKAVAYDTIKFENPNDFARWGAVAGDFAITYDGNTLVTIPDNTVIAPWTRVSSILKTNKNRYVIMPPWNLPDVSEFVVLSDKGADSVVLWDKHWIVDSHLTRCAFYMNGKDASMFGKKKSRSGIFIGKFIWREKRHFIVKENFIDLDEEILQMRISDTGFAVATENGILFTGKKTTHFENISNIVGFEILRNGTLVVLWNNGWQISFLNTLGERKDFLLLLQAEELHATVSGDAILVFPHRILEISEIGEILDYRQNEKATYNVTAQGYLEKTKNSVSWHYLDNSVLKDEFPESIENNTFAILDMPKSRAKIGGKNFELMAELLDYLIYFSDENPTDKIKELWENLPSGVEKDFDKLTASFGWLKKVVQGKIEFPVKIKKFTIDVT